MRTKGATSCVRVKLSDLTAKLDPTADVFIWRQQADMLGIIGKAEAANADTLKSSGNQPMGEEIISGTQIV